MPLTIGNASLVAADFDEPELMLYGIGVAPDGQPAINLRYVRGNQPEGKDKGLVVKWDGEAWRRLAFPRRAPRTSWWTRCGSTTWGGPGS